MTKKLGLLLGVAVGLFCLAPKSAQAGSLPRSPKMVYTTPYSLAVSTVSTQPGAVYEVILASGAASEYVLLCDSATATALTATSNVGGGSGFQNSANCFARLFFGATAANTDYKFDPPILLKNGLTVIDSAISGQATILYENGRGLSGN